VASTGTIVGIVIGVLALLVLIAVVVLLLRRQSDAVDAQKIYADTTDMFDNPTFVNAAAAAGAGAAYGAQDGLANPMYGLGGAAAGFAPGGETLRPLSNPTLRVPDPSRGVQR